MKRNIIQKIAALGLVAASSDAAFAQSVLERVLGQINNATNLAPVSGTYANIAENLGGSGLVETAVPGIVEQNNTLDQNELVLIGYIYFQDTGDAVEITGSTGEGPDIRFGDGDAVYGVAGENGVQLTEAVYQDDGSSGGTGYVISSVPNSNYATENGSANQIVAGSGSIADIGIEISLGAVLFSVSGDTFGATLTNQPKLNGVSLDIAVELVDGMVPAFVEVKGLYGIDGSIRNTVTGATETTATAIAGVTSATESLLPTLDFGNMATTALGAVNTGEITLGVDSTVDEAKSKTAKAISAALEQIGGSADSGAVVVNLASNMSAIDGSIRNALVEVNGTIGNLSTTALGAVNTGTIVSGVNTTVRGIVGTTVQ